MSAPSVNGTYLDQTRYPHWRIVALRVADRLFPAFGPEASRGAQHEFGSVEVAALPVLGHRDGDGRVRPGIVGTGVRIGMLGCGRGAFLGRGAPLSLGGKPTFPGGP